MSGKTSEIRPFHVLRVKPREFKPWIVAQKFVGRVNSHPLPRGIGAKQLLCTAISADETQDGNGFVVRYEFAPLMSLHAAYYEAMDFNEMDLDFSKEPEELK